MDGAVGQRIQQKLATRRLASGENDAHAATKLAADDPRSAMLAIHGLGCDAKPRAARAGLFAAIKKRGSDDDENVSPQTEASRAGLFAELRAAAA